VVPLARSSPSSTLSGEFLAGIAPAAPPLGPKNDIAKPQKISRGFCKTEGMVVDFYVFQGLGCK
jgi:hypothetical protein